MRCFSISTRVWRTLAVLVLAGLASCGTVRTQRVIDVREPPVGSGLRSTEVAPVGVGEPWRVETNHVAYRTLKTSIWIETDLELFVRAAVERRLESEVDECELVSAGWERVWGLLRANHDFVVRARVVVRERGLDGEFSGTVTGDELLHATRIFGDDWEARIPFTAEDPTRTDLAYRLERIADRDAWKLRLCLVKASERLARSVH